MDKLYTVHSTLMYLGFPYHSVSVIHRNQDLGYHVIFSKEVIDKVSDDVKSFLKLNEFTFSFV